MIGIVRFPYGEVDVHFRQGFRAKSQCEQKQTNQKQLRTEEADTFIFHARITRFNAEKWFDFAIEKRNKVKRRQQSEQDTRE
ncbi:hypothetical protein D3C76_1575370 [compost metagenome]